LKTHGGGDLNYVAALSRGDLTASRNSQTVGHPTPRREKKKKISSRKRKNQKILSLKGPRGEEESHCEESERVDPYHREERMKKRGKKREGQSREGGRGLRGEEKGLKGGKTTTGQGRVKQKKVQFVPWRHWKNGR